MEKKNRLEESHGSSAKVTDLTATDCTFGGDHSLPCNRRTCDHIGIFFYFNALFFNSDYIKKNTN